MFLARAWSIGEAVRGYFADSICAKLHKKKFITKEPRGRWKNLHLNNSASEGDRTKWMQELLCTRPDWATGSAARTP
jgi:hypothetical protein